jgi:hypothetical protein
VEETVKLVQPKPTKRLIVKTELDKPKDSNNGKDSMILVAFKKMLPFTITKIKVF